MHLYWRSYLLFGQTAEVYVNNQLMPVIISLCFSIFIGFGVFCLTAIEHPIDVALLGGFGAFFIGMAVTFLVWALARAGF